MPTPDKPHQALQLIFTFFLGLMVAAFIGIGVYTFHGPPGDPLEDPARDLRDQQREIRDARSPGGLTAEQQAELTRLSEEIREIEDRARQAREDWARTTSIILILLATGVMGVSLIRADQLPVISNGLLLGGVFTMLYGTGWTLASGDSQLRFWVVAFALLVTLGLGYSRFVRRQAETTAAPPANAAPTGALEARVDELERRLDAMGRALRDDD
jgi:hypothetical protein